MCTWETLMIVDAEVVRAAQSGDTRAMSALVDEFMPTVVGAAYGHCGDWELAGDIAQETFAVVITRLGDLREPAAFPGWLMAVVRSCTRRQRVAASPCRTALPAAPTDEVEQIVVGRDDARRTRLAVEALRPELRLPLALHYFAGRPLADIASLCDVPMSTVKKRMRVARAALREDMDEMVSSMEDRLRPSGDSDPSDVIRMYTAMRAGDLDRVAEILDARPDLIDQYLAQPFFIAEPVTGRPGESVSPQSMRERLVELASDGP
jgi:RNA polymerase sigma factor (sigma-70 family)